MGWPFWGFLGVFSGFLTGKNQYPTFQGGYCPARFRVKLSLTWKVFRPFRYALYDTLTQTTLHTPFHLPSYYSQLFRFRSTSKVLKSDLARTFSFSLKNPELQLWIIKAPNNTWKRGKKGVFLRYFGPPQKGSKTRAKREHFFLAVFFEKTPYLREPAFQGS